MATIENLDRFPRTLRQQNPYLGCIPTSVQAVLTYYEGRPATIRYEGKSRILDERTILEIFSGHENPLSICFSAVKQHVLDPYVGDRYSSLVEDKPDFGEWSSFVIVQVAESYPPLISYATPDGGSHIGTVIETGAAGFRIHDPGIGEFIKKSLPELSHQAK